MDSKKDLQVRIKKTMKVLVEESLKRPLSAIGRIKVQMDDPYKVLISCLLSLRAKDEQTYPISQNLFKVAPTVKDIASMPIRKLEALVKPINFYKTKARRIKDISKLLLKEYNGIVPDDFDELMKFKGVGRKTANIVITYGFEQSSIAVDIHVHRISNRLGWIKTDKPDDSEFALKDIVPKKFWKDVNELFVTHGQTICTPVSPRCSICPIEKFCKKKGVTRTR